MMNLKKRTIAGLVVFGMVIAALLYLLFPLGMVQYLTDKQRLLAVIKEHRANAAFIFIGLQVLQVVAAPVPGEVTGFVGGLFFGPFGGVLYSTIGLTLGSWLAFILARFAGRPLVETFVNPETIKRYDYVMKHKGLFLAFLMFLIPGFPKDLLCYLLGSGTYEAAGFSARVDDRPTARHGASYPGRHVLPGPALCRVLYACRHQHCADPDHDDLPGEH